VQGRDDERSRDDYYQPPPRQSPSYGGSGRGGLW
jgi:hypothetical protein